MPVIRRAAAEVRDNGAEEIFEITIVKNLSTLVMTTKSWSLYFMST